jgi:hypothetical protein
MKKAPLALHFGELRSPCDLLRKLEYDLARMTSASSDHYAAFDFFVTADSLVDWNWPEQPDDQALDSQNREVRRKVRKLEIMPRIAAHIANGGKHFVVTRHNSITGVEKARIYAEGVLEERVFYEPVLVHLTSEEAGALGCATSVEAEFLASKLLEYWRSKLNNA